MRYCLQPGCSAIVQRGYCRPHARSTRLAARGSQRERGYTYAWEQRARLFRKLYPLCGMRPGGLAPVMSACHDTNRATPAELVDHVVPHGGDPSLFWDELNNWQSLCQSCHSRKTASGA
jgi:5-methylcytosine-specific restriction enzyme A